MVSCWAHLGHTVQSPVRDPWTSSKWVKASIAHNTAAHNESRSGPRSNKTTLAACKTMLSSLSGCVLKKKIASSGSSLCNQLHDCLWFFRCTAKALGAWTVPWARWDSEGWCGLLTAHAISHRDAAGLAAELPCTWYVTTCKVHRARGFGVLEGTVRALLWPRVQKTHCFWRRWHLNPKIRFRNSSPVKSVKHSFPTKSTS